MPDYIDQIIAGVMFAITILIMLAYFIRAVVRTFKEPANTPAPVAVVEATPEQVAAHDAYVIACMEYEERKNANLDRVLNSDNPC